MLIHDLERLPPDGAGGPEQRDPLDAGGHSRKANCRGVSLGGIECSLHRYGDDASQLGELFLPDDNGRLAGVVVVIHGGYWRARYDRSLMTALCEDLAAHGLAAWNLEYRRVGNGGGWPETFLDVAAGVDLLAGLDAPLDLDRVGAVGHSAGGHLALWAAARARLPAGAPGASPRVRPRAVVSQAGVADLRLAAVTSPSDEPTRELLGGASDVFALASPRELVPLGVDQLVLHGDRDETVAIEIAHAYAGAATAAGDPCELRVLPGVGHFEHIDASTETWRIARDWLAERLRAVS
jgi:acetyl esterase/lipase